MIATKINMVTPAISTLRVKHEPKLDTNNEAPKRKHLYLDIAPDAATDCIVRLLLPEPRLNEDAGNLYSLKTVLTLVTLGGSLRRAAPNAFGTVQFSVNRMPNGRAAPPKFVALAKRSVSC